MTGVDRPDVSTRVAVRFGVPRPQRRVTVFFRLILAIPHFIVLEFVAIAALVVLALAWFAALFTGRMPVGPGRFLCGYLRWVTRVDAYLFLLTDQYPPFQLDPSPDYPVDFVVQTGRLNRWAVLFRYFLAIPAAIAVGMVTVGLSIFSVVLWVATLIRGTMPQWMFEAVSAVLRYRARFSAYYFLQTSFQPSEVMGDGHLPGGSPEAWAPSPPVAYPTAEGYTTAPVPPASGNAPDGGAYPPMTGVPAAPPPPPPPPQPSWSPSPQPASDPEEGGAAPVPDVNESMAEQPEPRPPQSVEPSSGDPESGGGPSAQWPSLPPPPYPGSPTAPPGSPPPNGSPPLPPPPWDPSTPAAYLAAPPPMQPVQFGSAQAALPPEWQVVLSAGARKLVVILFILGAIGYVAYTGFVVNNISRINSDTQRNNAQVYASQAYQSLAQQAQTLEQQLQSCLQNTPSNALSCRQTFDDQFGVAIGNYGGELDTIDFPSSVSAEADAAESAASDAAGLLNDLADVNSAPNYAQAVQSLGAQAKIDAVDTTYRDLQEALARS